MQDFAISKGQQTPVARLGMLRRLRGDQRGTTAVEFGILALPFFLFVFGIMAIGLQFFTINALDHGVEVAARKIRTGQAQKEGKTIKQFKEMVCAEATDYIAVDCDDKLVVHVQSGPSWASIVPRPCASGGTLTPKVGADTDALAGQSGTAGAVVLITVCYDWTLPVDFPYLQLMMMRPADNIPLSSGGSLVQAVATFRTEPYQ